MCRGKIDSGFAIEEGHGGGWERAGTVETVAYGGVGGRGRQYSCSTSETACSRQQVYSYDFLQLVLSILRTQGKSGPQGPQVVGFPQEFPAQFVP